MKKAFTLIEIIIVIIIVGILAALGISQYSIIVERGRITEAKTRLGTMRQLAQEYYLNNGTVTGITNADVGVVQACSSSSFFSYYVMQDCCNRVLLRADRCTSGGKPPVASRPYVYYIEYFPANGYTDWRCQWSDNWSNCPELL